MELAWSAHFLFRYGRKPAVLAPYFIAACFSFGTATAKDIQTILITRFFAGLFGSAPVTNTGGVLGDIWAPQQRGTAIVGYAFAVVGGPTIGVSALFWRAALQSRCFVSLEAAAHQSDPMPCLTLLTPCSQ